LSFVCQLSKRNLGGILFRLCIQNSFSILVARVLGELQQGFCCGINLFSGSACIASFLVICVWNPMKGFAGVVLYVFRLSLPPCVLFDIIGQRLRVVTCFLFWFFLDLPSWEGSYVQ
jgi:hypothetical protein